MAAVFPGKVNVPPKRKLAVGYVRVSTDMQVQEGQSIETQEQLIHDYCGRNQLRFLKLYADEAKSGRNMERPQLQLMLEELEPGMVVVASALSRISRSVKDFLQIVDKIKEKRASLVLLDLNVDTSTASGEFMMNVMAAVSQFERKQTAERISAVMTNMSREGRLRSKPRYGYTLVDGVPVPIPEEQAVIEMIRAMIAADNKIAVAEIVRRLEKEEVKIRKSQRIYHNTISKIIKDNNLRPTTTTAP